MRQTRLNRRYFCLGVMGSACISSRSRADGLAEMVLYNGRISTINMAQSEVQAIAITKGRIVEIGSDKDILSKYADNKTQIIDLQGRRAIPGFIDAHAHFLGLGEALERLDLTRTNSWEDIAAMVGDAAKTADKNQWILGRGWHQEKWSMAPDPHVQGYPVHTALSQAAPRNPVMLIHASGHCCMVNAEAMRRAGVTRNTLSPDGGEILHDKDGEPSGLFREAAQELIRRAHQQSRQSMTSVKIENEMHKRIDLASNECLRYGVTGFHDAGSSFRTIDLFRNLEKEGKLKVRLAVMINENDSALREQAGNYNSLNQFGGFLSVLGIKRFADGALGSHGAWLLEPYADLPDHVGLPEQSAEELLQTAQIALENKWQLCTHAIGDRANRVVLDVYQKALSSGNDGHTKRWRIEHAQHLHPDDIPRFAKLDIIASMQACHATSDGPYVAKRLGDDRAKTGAYVWRDLLDSGAMICNGTDAPVEPVDPIANFHAAVTREMADGRSFYPKQCMMRFEALRSSTLHAAYASFSENHQGALRPGYYADIVVLSKDIMTSDKNSIQDAEVDLTIINGAICYQR